MSIERKVLGTSPSGGDALTVEDVFSTYLYTGNGATQTIENGIALGDSNYGASVEFDGVGDYLSRSTDMTGNADGKTFTISAWVNTKNARAPFYYNSSSSANNIGIELSSGGNFSFINSVSSAWRWNINSTSAVGVLNTWQHVLFSFDADSQANCKLYVDDVAVPLTFTTFSTGSNVVFTSASQVVGAISWALNAKTKGRLSNLFLDYTYRDLSIESNRRLFITADGQPASKSGLEALNPIMYMPLNDTDGIGSNLGTGGDFTVNGSPKALSIGGPYIGDGVGQGGMVWIKIREANGGEENHRLFDTQRGANLSLQSNTNAVQNSHGNSLAAFNADGFLLDGHYLGTNGNGYDYASWTFRKAPRFFDVVTYTGDGVTGREIAHDLGCDVGMLIVKRTDIADDWDVLHKDVEVLRLNTTDAVLAGYAPIRFGDGSNLIRPTSSVFTVGSSGETNGSGGTYVAYLFAHDPEGENGDDGMIACGSYVGSYPSNIELDIGFEPQYMLVKNVTQASNWVVSDSIRGITSHDGWWLAPDSSAAENGVTGASPFGTLTSTGIEINSGLTAVNVNGDTFIYMAIRRPMKTPEVGTEVFSPVHGISQTPSFVTDFAVDMIIQVQSNQPYNSNRLTGEKYLKLSSTNAEGSDNTEVWDYSNGQGTSGYANAMGYAWKRATGFFDVVAYTGDGVAGRTVAHNLGVVPEMMWVKKRDVIGNWQVYHSALGNAKSNYLDLTNTPATHAAFWNNTSPTATQFTLGAGANLNGSGNTYIAYLFATLDGISKVGSYTGNGTNQTIDCGFSTGARFILIKRTDSTGDWFTWDTERGIVAGNDPHLSLNTTAAEVTTDDSVDPDSSGFIVNQVAATNINVSAGEYIFYSIA
jgi:hypothetical protein